jgi:hypothetical protein
VSDRHRDPARPGELQVPVSLTPFGRAIVDIDQARRLGIQPALAMPADPSAERPR